LIARYIGLFHRYGRHWRAVGKLTRQRFYKKQLSASNLDARAIVCRNALNKSAIAFLGRSICDTRIFLYASAMDSVNPYRRK
jgi:hypothetical protein